MFVTGFDSALTSAEADFLGTVANRAGAALRHNLGAVADCIAPTVDTVTTGRPAMTSALAAALQRATENMRSYALKREALRRGLISADEASASSERSGCSRASPLWRLCQQNRSRTPISNRG